MSAALVRASVAEGAAAAERGGAVALRGELRQLAAEYEQHHAELKVRAGAATAGVGGCIGKCEETLLSIHMSGGQHGWEGRWWQLGWG